jgi:hypothetical protein
MFAYGCDRVKPSDANLELGDASKRSGDAELGRREEQLACESSTYKSGLLVVCLAFLAARFSFNDLPVFFVLCFWGTLPGTTPPLLVGTSPCSERQEALASHCDQREPLLTAPCCLEGSALAVRDAVGTAPDAVNVPHRTPASRPRSPTVLRWHSS